MTCPRRPGESDRSRMTTMLGAERARYVDSALDELSRHLKSSADGGPEAAIRLWCLTLGAIAILMLPPAAVDRGQN